MKSQCNRVEVINKKDQTITKQTVCKSFHNPIDHTDIDIEALRKIGTNHHPFGIILDEQGDAMVLFKKDRQPKKTSD